MFKNIHSPRIAAELIADFEQKINNYCKTATNKLSAIVNRFETIVALQQQVSAELDRLSKIQNSSNILAFQTIDDLFQRLETNAKAIQYNGISFRTFEMLDNLMTRFYIPEEDKFIEEIEEFLVQQVPTLANPAGIDDIKTTEIKIIITKEIGPYLLTKTDSFVERIEKLTDQLQQAQFDFKLNVVECYRQAIAAEKKRLLPQNSPQTTESSLSSSETELQSFPELKHPIPKSKPERPEIEDSYEIPAGDELATLLTGTIDKNLSKKDKGFLFSLNTVWGELFDDHKTTESLKENLHKLYQKLCKMDNYVHYWYFFRGETMHVKNEHDTFMKKRFPKHIKLMLEKFQTTAIDQMSDQELMRLRNSLIGIAREALEAPAQSCCWGCCHNFFQPRHRLTQQIYQSMASPTLKSAAN